MHAKGRHALISLFVFGSTVQLLLKGSRPVKCSVPSDTQSSPLSGTSDSWTSAIPNYARFLLVLLVSEERSYTKLFALPE